MAAAIAISGATQVLKLAVTEIGNLAVRAGSRLFKLKEEIEWIENEMGYIQAYLEDADVDDEEGGSRVEAALLNNIRVLSYDVEDVVETYFPQIASQGRKGRLRCLKNAVKCLFNNYKAAHDLAAEIEGIRRRVENINRVRQTYGITLAKKIRTYTWDPRRTFPHLDDVNVVGFDDHIDKLKGKVLDEHLQYSVVSIIGMAGLGKTTLAKKVYHSVRKDFDCSAWICVSQQPNIPELFRDIARQVGLEKKEWEHDVVGNLHEELLQKRYVIVIDDIWYTESWNALKNGIPTQTEKSSRIILTSRNRDVGVHIGGQSSVHELKPLDPENSRDLFFKRVGGPPQNMKEKSENLENIIEQILKRCGGVPLAIVLTAGMLLLRERTQHAWEGVLKNMGGQEEDECSKIFALSYKDLPTKLKPCFLYFGLFPEDYEVGAFDMINLWAAEGFIRRGSGVQEVQEVGEEYLNHLIARNLIQVARRRFDGRIKSCRIHDILHGLCVKVAKEINFFNTDNDLVAGKSAMRLQRVTTYSCNLLENISRDHRTPKLRAMLCFNKEEGGRKGKHVKNFLRDSRFLRVLHLESECLRISLPSEIGNLSHLSYIGLKVKQSRVILPSAICNLRSLQTLDARGCYGVLIIPDCIWKMKQLRHLLLPWYNEIKFDLGGLLLNMCKFFFHPPIEAASPNLQTFYMLRISTWHAKYKFPKFTSLRKLGVSFANGEWSKVKEFLDATIVPHKLEILQLCDFSNTQCNILELRLSRYENLSRLHLEVSIVKLPQHDELPPNLTKLTLESTFLKDDPMETLKKLSKLKILKFSVGSYIGEKMTVCSSGERVHDNFPQLQVLEITGLHFLKELMVDDNVMPQLNKLRIKGCHHDLVTRIPNRIRDKMITI